MKKHILSLIATSLVLGTVSEVKAMELALVGTQLVASIAANLRGKSQPNTNSNDTQPVQSASQPNILQKFLIDTFTELESKKCTARNCSDGSLLFVKPLIDDKTYKATFKVTYLPARLLVHSGIKSYYNKDLNQQLTLKPGFTRESAEREIATVLIPSPTAECMHCYSYLIHEELNQTLAYFTGVVNNRLHYGIVDPATSEPVTGD